MIVSQNPYNTSEYVKLGTYNFEIVKYEGNSISKLQIVI